MLPGPGDRHRPLQIFHRAWGECRRILLQRLEELGCGVVELVGDDEVGALFFQIPQLRPSHRRELVRHWIGHGGLEMDRIFRTVSWYLVMCTSV